ncbi:MAG: site-specific DNA-methyltransferase [Clostridia bacterium]|nr:site-specific DNA-methyltransferase [Clostridia bacterium]
MESKKVSQGINDFVNDNIQALAQLFPSVIKDGLVDFEALKEELGQFEEVDKEKYELTWSGKQGAKKKAQEDVFGRTLNYIEEDSKHAATTENLYIEGDNLEVLKLLRQNYYGAIKMIYIDPPYNTGNDFVYKDNFKMNVKESEMAEGNVDEEGNPLQRNQQSSNRFHANWLNMMYPRLKVAKDLLTDDGVIFISIDDNEQANLKKICDEIFGSYNFISNFVWQKGKEGGNDSTTMRSHYENVLLYSKTNSKDLNLINLDKKDTSRHILKDKEKNLVKGIERNENEGELFQLINLSKQKDYNVNIPLFDGTILKWNSYAPQNTINNWIKIGKIFVGEKKVPYVKSFLKDELNGQKPSNIIEQKFGTTKSGSIEIRSFFGNKDFFSYPKPSTLIKRLIQIGSQTDSIILDFFSGSATTAHATMQLNAEDGGNRKFIMVQLPEKTDENSEAYIADYKNICEIGKERIRRAGDQIKTEVEKHNSQLKEGDELRTIPDIGFKVFRTSDTNIKWNMVDSLGQMDIEKMTHTPDLVDFNLEANDIDIVYEIMLRQKDIPLSEKIEQLTEIGKRTYLYGSAYLICLETDISEELVNRLAAIEPLPVKYVFRDSAFKADIALKDETFRRLKTLIERNSGASKKTYTVEFI